MHQIEEVLDTLIKLKFKVFFTSDASNSYWAVKIKAGDEYKAGIVTPHGQYVYLQMGQGLKGAPYTYSQFTDLIFGPLPPGKGSLRFPSIIGDIRQVAFSPFMDDHAAAATDYNSMFEFLHNMYFP